MEKRNYPPEFCAPWELSYNLFRKCYVNFFENSYKEWRLYVIGLFAVIHNVTMWVFLSKISTEDINMFDIVYMILICSLTLQACIKSIIVLHRKPDIEDFIDELATIWRSTNLTSKQIETKKRYINQLKLHHTIYFWFNTSATFIHIGVPLIVVLFRRIILSENCKLSLAFNSVFPFDYSANWMIYLATYGFQTYAMLNIVYGLVGSEVMLLTFAGILSMEFGLLRDDLELVIPLLKADDIRDQPLLEEQRNIDNYRKLSIEEFVRRHQQLLRLAEGMDDVFNKIILLSILSTSFSICLFGFASTVAQGFVETVSNIVGVLGMLLHVFMYCYYGELMKNESFGLADSAYNNLWYKGDAKFQRMIVFTIARSQKPCCLTAWRQVPVTLNTFAKVSSSAWSYFSLVTTVYSNHEESNTE